MAFEASYGQQGAARREPEGSLREVPWQIWVVVVMLGLEGVGNLLLIPQVPAAAKRRMVAGMPVSAAY